MELRGADIVRLSDSEVSVQLCMAGLLGDVVGVGSSWGNAPTETVFAEKANAAKMILQCMVMLISSALLNLGFDLGQVRRNRG